MSTPRMLTVAVALLMPMACTPAVQVNTVDPTLNSRWHANLATPASLAGAVQMKGTASMAPSAGGASTTIWLNLANAAPGGRHPWGLHRGQCGAWTDEGVFGPAEAYKTLEVESDGNAASTAIITVVTPRTGNYFVVVSASVANPATVVACGNLAPPTQ